MALLRVTSTVSEEPFDSAARLSIAAFLVGSAIIGAAIIIAGLTFVCGPLPLPARIAVVGIELLSAFFVAGACSVA